jgi:hypothetical protein
VIALLGIADAWAAGAGAVQGPTILLGVVAAAWLAAHLLVERAQQRFLALTGVEYVALGVVLGPAVLPGVGLFEDEASTRPLFAFVVGWIGFLTGISFDPGLLVRSRRSTFGAVLDVALRGGLAGLVGWAVLAPAHGDDLPARIAVAALACAAAAPSPAAAQLLASRYPDRGSTLLPFLLRWSPPASALAITLLGGAFCLFHRGETIAVRPPGPAEWTMFTVGIGVVLAVSFLLFLGRDRSQNHVFLAATGTLLFASGAAFFLHLSALAVNFVLGVALARTTVGPGIRDAVDRTAGPARILLLLFAGTLWRPVDPALGLLLPAGVLVARIAGGFLSGFASTLWSGLRGDLVRGTWAQGDVAVAIAVSLRIGYDGPAVDLVYHTILVAVAFSELTAPRALRGLLVDAGEIDEDVPAPPRAAA